MKWRNVDIRQQLLAVQRKGYGKVQIGGFTFDQEISREKLACAIILHEYPLSIVEWSLEILLLVSNPCLRWFPATQLRVI